MRARIEDAEFLLAEGVAPIDVAARLGTTPAALYRLMYRHRRADLAVRFSRVARQQYPDRKRRKYRETFPRYHPDAARWAAANGYPMASGHGRVTKAAFTAWEQAQQATYERAA